MNNNFPSKPDFYIGGIVPLDLLIDRHHELKDAKRTLLERKENVLIVGKRRIGKTSFARKLKNEIEKEKFLSIEINLVTYDSQPISFLREILLLLCYQMGEKIFKKSTSELLSSLGNPPRSLKGDFGNFYKLYKLVRFFTLTQTRTSTVDASIQSPLIGSVGAGKRKEETTELNGIQSIEFINIVEELMKICKKANYQSVVVFADEANRLTSDTNKEILSQYFDIFSSKQIQFVFIGDTSLIDYKLVEDIFGITIRMHGFESIDDIQELLRLYYRRIDVDYATVFTSRAIRKIWEASKGHPYIVQLLCSNSVDEAHEKKRSLVEDSDVAFAWVKLINKDHRLLDLVE